MDDDSSLTPSTSSYFRAVEHRYDLICRPIKNLSELEIFLKAPPAWRSLCVDLKPHSDYSVRNLDIVRQNRPLEDIAIEPERPETFCHSRADLEDVARVKRAELPKTLVCHDMANGYHDDSKIDGTSNADAYTFYNWAVVDIFCYFSHHFITVPPLGWINTAHQHGVKIIGTVITERGEGAATWAGILADSEECQRFAHALVRVAKLMRFDGWLLNIENKVDKPETLVEFVQFLHALLHRELPEPLLIWYDSVTVDGHLHWQNCLNARNRAFFDACDGIFTNYSWTEADVRASGAAAGRRAHDVFVGVDVWGRNFLGGGHFNTQHAVKIIYEHGCSMAIFAPAWTHEAMADEELGVAPGSRAPRVRPARKFALRERALWGSLWPLLYTKLPRQLPFQTSFCRGQGRKRWLYGEVLGPGPWYNLRHQQYQPNSSHGPHGYALAANVVAEVEPKDKDPTEHKSSTRHEITLKDSFQNLTTLSVTDGLDDEEPELDTSVESLEQKRTLWRRIRDVFRRKEGQKDGAGTVESSPSLVISSGKSMQQISMRLRLGQHKDSRVRYTLVYLPDELECLEPHFSDGFTGGSCLAINPCDETDAEPRFVRLFHCDFDVDSTLIVCVVTKVFPEDAGQYLNIVLSVTNRYGAHSRLTLIGRDLPRGTGNDAHAPLHPSDPVFKELQKYLLMNEPSFYVATENPFGWKVRYYSLAMRGRVTTVHARTGLGAGPVLLGHLGLCQR